MEINKFGFVDDSLDTFVTTLFDVVVGIQT